MCYITEQPEEMQINKPLASKPCIFVIVFRLMLFKLNSLTLAVFYSI